MPEVSTTIRSKPLSLQQASTSGSAADSSVPVSRVASERMKIWSESIAFMRMRSPSSAPPVRLRDGSIEMHGDAQPILLIEPQPQDEFVGQRGLAGAAGAGDAEHRRLDAGSRLQQRLADAHRIGAILDRGDDPGELAPVARTQRLERLGFRRAPARTDRSRSRG